MKIGPIFEVASILNSREFTIFHKLAVESTNMEISAVIPARLNSSRLSRKVLADIHGKPMLWHVWQRVQQVDGLKQVLIATDSIEVYRAVVDWGGHAIMTSPSCRSGTERISSIIDQIEADKILNVQGDEPLIDPRMLEKLIAAWGEVGGDLITPVFPIRDQSDLFNPNIVKVARSLDGRALYFSRSPIPYIRDLPSEHWLERGVFYGHIGVYGYRRDVLIQYPTLPESHLERAERLEQLRFLDAGFRIQTIETNYRSIAVDTFADIERVRQILRQAG